MQFSNSACESMAVCEKGTSPVAFALSGQEWESFFTPGDRLTLLERFPTAVILPEKISGPDLVERINASGCRVLVGGWSLPPLPTDRAVFPGLEYVGYLAGGIRRKIPRSLLEQGLLVSNWGNSIARIVAECGLLLLLMCYREASHWQIRMHQKGAFKSRCEKGNLSLFQRRIGIHGFGAVAQALTDLLRPFHVEIAAYSPWPDDAVFAAKGVRRFASLEQLFEWSDAVVEAEACSPQTIRSVKELHLRLLGDGVFVNIARAELVEEDALIRVAREGRLKLGLDVYHQEPLPADYPLCGLPNVALLPHLGGPTWDRRVDAGALALKNISRFLEGRPVEFPISLEQYDRMT